MNRSTLLAEFPDSGSLISASNCRDLIGVTWIYLGAWSNATAYTINDVVTEGGSAYLCIAANTNQSPPNATYWQAIGGAGGGSGSVTSVSLSAPNIFSVSGSPVTASGTLSLTLANQNANLVFASPSSGGAGTPTFRAIAIADVPTLNQNTTGTAANVTGTVAIANGGTSSTTAAAARTALGLGTAATQASTAFDASGAAATAQSNAEASAASLYLPLAGGTLSGSMGLNGNEFDLDSVASFSQSNGVGNWQVTYTTLQNEGTATAGSNNDQYNNSFGFEIQSNWTLSGSTPATDLLVIRNEVSGSSTGLQLLLDLQTSGNNINATSQFHVLTTGDFYAAGGSITTLSGVITAKGFRPPSWSANTTIFVDGLNGNDSTGNGSQTNPYKTISHAASVASSGNLIFVGAGTYSITTQIVLPNGVSLIGSGRGITILNNASLTNEAVIVPGNGSIVGRMTNNAAFGTSGSSPPIGFSSQASSGSTQISNGFKLFDGEFNGFIDALYCSVSPGTAAGSTTISASNCEFASGWDTTQFVSNTAQTYIFTIEFDNCTFNNTYGLSGSSSLTMRSLTGQASVIARGCIFNLTDTTNSNASGRTYVVDDTGLAVLENCAVNINTPNFSSSFACVNDQKTSGSGDGVTVVETLSTGTTTRRGPLIASTLTVASSAVTPALAGVDEVATDAGSLSSNALTINTPAIYGNGYPIIPDGQAKRIRIKNTNASSTAMTLSLGTGYDASAFTIGTIAAGKKAYLDFTYDADNSKWDLTGYVNGV